MFRDKIARFIQIIDIEIRLMAKWFIFNTGKWSQWDSNSPQMNKDVLIVPWGIIQPLFIFFLNLNQVFQSTNIICEQHFTPAFICSCTIRKPPNGGFIPCPELLTEDEAIRYLRLDVNGPQNPKGTLKYYRDKGILKGVRVGKNLRYPRKELDRMIDKLLEKKEDFRWVTAKQARGLWLISLYY